MTSSSILLANPALIGVGITHGFVTVEEMEDLKAKYEVFLTDLEKEWPSKRIQEYLVALKREEYQKTALLLQKLERDNHDARVRGVSYKDRQSFTVKMNIGREVVQRIKQHANLIKSSTYTVRGCTNPTDMEHIQYNGFEAHLKVVHSTPLVFHR